MKRRWQRNHLIAKYGNKCYYCDVAFKSIKEITFDHLVPLSRGGYDEIDNYRLAHLSCNQLKGNMTEDEFDEFQNEK